MTQWTGMPDELRVLKEDARRARELIAIRQLRDRVFDDRTLFGEPAWAMLLDIFVADIENRLVSISSACIASGVPPTTALRHIGRLIRRELLVAVPDQADSRRRHLHLTGRAFTLMQRVLRNPLVL